jgi:pimeloyl-ACP methyl ester carboxylesterase
MEVTNDMREKSREKYSQENKSPSKVHRMVISASFVLAFLIVLTANEAVQARAMQDANENRAYRSESVLRKVQVGDIEIAYKLFGKGEPLVLIHGYGGSMDIWDPQLLKVLAENHTVIVFNNRGVGNTTGGLKQYSIEQLADDTAGLLDALGISKSNVLGWSMGGMVAQELVLNHPDKVNNLILYASTCGGNESPLPEKEVLETYANRTGTPTERIARLMPLLFPEEWQKAHPNYQTAMPRNTQVSPNQTLNVVLNAAFNWGGTCNQLQQIDQPTLVIIGTDDKMILPSNSLTIAERIPDAWLVQIDGGGHGLMYQYPETVSKMALTFLEKGDN